MDTLIRSVFNHFLTTFCEPLAEEGIQLSFLDGIVVRDLKIKPDAINAALEKQEADLRVDGGQIGFLRICYTALPGVVTMQMNGIDLRIRPNAIRTLGKVVKKSIVGMLTPDDPLERAGNGEYPHVQADGNIILTPYYHEPSQCIYHREEIVQDGVMHHYFCDRCALPLHSGGPHTAVFHIIKVPVPDPPEPLPRGQHLPRVNVDDEEIVYLSPKQMQRMLQDDRQYYVPPPRLEKRRDLSRAMHTANARVHKRLHHLHQEQQPGMKPPGVPPQGMMHPQPQSHHLAPPQHDLKNSPQALPRQASSPLYISTPVTVTPNPRHRRVKTTRPPAGCLNYLCIGGAEGSPPGVDR